MNLKKQIGKNKWWWTYFEKEVDVRDGERKLDDGQQNASLRNLSFLLVILEVEKPKWVVDYGN